MYGVFRLEGDFFEFFIESGPKLFSEDDPVVEGIAGGIFHLFFEDAIELLDGIVDDLLLLAFKLLLEFHCKLVHSDFAPLLLVGDVLDVVGEALEGLRLQVLYFFKVLLLAEDLAGSLQELSEAIISDQVGLLQEALLNLVAELLLQLTASFVDLSLDVPDGFSVIVAENFINNVSDIGCKLHVEGSFAFFNFVPELVEVGLVGLLFDFLTAHAGEEHFFLGQVDVLVLLDGSPDVLHVLRQVSHWDVVLYQFLVAGTLHQEPLEVADARLPVLLLALLQLGGKEEDMQFKDISESDVGLVSRLGNFAPGIIDLGDQFFLQRLRVLLLLHEVSHNEDNLLRSLRTEQLQVQLENHLQNLQLSSLERTDLLDPDVDQQRVRNRKSEQ